MLDSKTKNLRSRLCISLNFLHFLGNQTEIERKPQKESRGSSSHQSENYQHRPNKYKDHIQPNK